MTSLPPMWTQLRWLPLLFLIATAAPVHAEDAGPQQILNLLDYVAVEYPAFVRGGAVLDADEYTEQVEFSGQIEAQIRALPANPERDQLAAQAAQLRVLVAKKGDGRTVVQLAQQIQRQLIQAYDVVVTPRHPPELADAAALYASNCANCHGPLGNGTGPHAKDLDPRPSDFTDRERAAARSVYGLFNTISLGVAGTSMPAFQQLPPDERWKLAFYVSQLSATDQVRAEGARKWAAGSARGLFRELKDVVLTTPTQAHGADDVLAYLRAQPAALFASGADPIAFALTALAQSHDAWKTGRVDVAYRLALSAYLEGFELAEASVDHADSSLRVQIEQAMMAYRNAVNAGQADSAVDAAYERARALLLHAQERTADVLVSPAANFASALIIILREGLEAILVLAAMGAFLVRTGRREGLHWLHGGWLAALAAGALTWYVSGKLISISGAQREVTEGVTALISSAVLLYVGFWLHGKASAAKWSAFIRSQLTGATSRNTWFGVAMVAFLAVYREVFETVLFYQALWVQASGPGRNAVLAGLAIGALALVVIAWLIVRFSVRLPLSLFFGASSALLAIMAVVFAGQGIAALQEAGKLPVNPVDIPAVPVLGIYPNAQGLVLQLVLVGLILGGFLYMRTQTRRAERTARAVS